MAAVRPDVAALVRRSAAQALIAAEIVHAEDKELRSPTVREFLSQFHSLSSTAKGKAILEGIGAHGLTLRDLHGDDRLIAALLAAMQTMSQSVNPRRLGMIGGDHLAAWAEAHGADPESFVYRRELPDHDGLQYVIEAGFAHAPSRCSRLDVAGLNFSPVVGGHPFGRIDAVLGECLVGRAAPAIVFLHLVCPRLAFTDKGKSSVELPPIIGRTMQNLVESATKKWTKQAKAEIRDHSAWMGRREALARRPRVKQLTKQEAAFAVVPEAYRKASGNDTLPTNPRQIFYVARPRMLAILPEGSTIDSVYFTQTLFPAYLKAHPEETANWKIDWDERGHFVEPHTEFEFGVRTANVRGYIASLAPPKINGASLAGAEVETRGPAGRYGGVLYIEKEGFEALMKVAQIERRFDIAVISNKGFSVTAGRQLIDELCGRCGLPLYILHDFDVSGFGIAKTLVSDSDRYTFRHKIERIADLGLRLGDVRAEHLDNEEVSIGRDYRKTTARLKINGADNAEIAYLLDGEVDDEGKIVNGHRVELNAMTSDQFVAFVERKLTENGARKIVPNKVTLDQTLAAFAREKIAGPVVERYLARLQRVAIATPADLEARVRAHLAEHPAETWDAAVRQIANGDG